MSFYQKLILKSAIISVAAKAVGFFGSIYYIREVLPAVGSNYFGMWMTLLSLLIVINYIDFGVLNSLMNHVTEESIRDDKFNSKTETAIITFAIVIAFALFAIVSLISVIAAASSYFEMDKSSNDKDVSLAIFAFAFHAAFAFMQNAFGVILNAKNAAWISNSILLINNIITVCGVYLVINLNYGFLGLATSGALVSMLMLFFYTQKIQVKPGFYMTRKSILRDFKIIWENRSAAMKFAIIQAGVLFLFGLDLVSVSIFKGADEATRYAVLQRIYSPIIILAAVVNTPLWALYAQAALKHDLIVIRKMFLQYLVVTVALSVLFIIIVEVCKEQIFDLLRIDVGAYPRELMLLYAVYTMLLVMNNFICILSNGTSHLCPQIIFYLFAIAVIYPVKLLLLKLYELEVMMAIVNLLLAMALAPFFTSLYRSTKK